MATLLYPGVITIAYAVIREPETTFAGPGYTANYFNINDLGE
jgi:hypothetical protein